MNAIPPMVRKTPIGANSWLKGLVCLCVFFFCPACTGSARVGFAFKHSSNKLGQHLRQQAQNEKHIMAAADFPQAKYNTRLQEN